MSTIAVSQAHNGQAVEVCRTRPEARQLPSLQQYQSKCSHRRIRYLGSSTVQPLKEKRILRPRWFLMRWSAFLRGDVLSCETVPMQWCTIFGCQMCCRVLDCIMSESQSHLTLSPCTIGFPCGCTNLEVKHIGLSWGSTLSGRTWWTVESVEQYGAPSTGIVSHPCVWWHRHVGLERRCMLLGLEWLVNVTVAACRGFVQRPLHCTFYLRKSPDSAYCLSPS